MVTHELRLQRVEGRPVGQRDEPVHVEPLDQPERDEVREHQDDHGVQEHEHTVDELLEHAGVETEPQGPGGLERLRVGADVAVTHQSGEQRHATTPHEEGPDTLDAGEDQAVALELGPVHEHVPAPEEVQEQEDHEAASQLDQVAAGDREGRDVQGVDGGFLLLGHLFTPLLERRMVRTLRRTGTMVHSRGRSTEWRDIL